MPMQFVGFRAFVVCFAYIGYVADPIAANLCHILADVDAVECFYAFLNQRIFIHVDTIGGLTGYCLPKATEYAHECFVLLHLERDTVFVLALMRMLRLGTWFAKGILILFLIGAGEGLVGFVRYNCQLIQHFIIGSVFTVIYALTLLIDTDTQSTAYLLSFLVLGIAFVECGDAKDIRVVPSHTKGRV